MIFTKRVRDVESHVDLAFSTFVNTINAGSAFSLLARQHDRHKVVMSAWNLGADDVSEETRTFKDKIASKGERSRQLH